MPVTLTRAGVKAVLRRPPVVIAILTVTAILASLGVTHLVTRYGEQEKALARHLYAQGQAEMDSGKPELAIDYFRAALTYDRSDFEYQLILARALRDTGRTNEARTYLMNLWEHSPEDGAVNLALGRLAAREGLTDEAIHYYHNAMYGVWAADPELRRRNAQLELIDFLLRRNAGPDAEAELITLAASLPRGSEVETRVAQMFAEAGDYERALSEYQMILQHDHENAAAQAGAGEAAFQLGRYATAEKYLNVAARLDSQNAQAGQMLQTARLVMQIDPFLRQLSSPERDRRIRLAFDRAGERLQDCSTQEIDERIDETESDEQKSDTKVEVQKAAPQNAPEQTSSTDLASLQQEYLALKSKLGSHHNISESESADTFMNLVFQVEQQTRKTCSGSNPLDQAVLLLSHDRDGVDQ